MSRTGLLVEDGRASRFFRKPTREKIAALAATAKHVLHLKRVAEAGSGLIGHRLAVPRVVQGAAPFYMAIRPDADLVFHALPELAALARLWTQGNKAPNAADLPRLYMLALNVRAVLAEGVTGEFAELGVYRGNSAAVLAHYARGVGRRLSLFDTFEGFDVRDLIGVDQRAPREFADTSLEAVRPLVGDEGVRYLPGRFPDSFPADMAETRFSVVHLDCDLYEPIRAGMQTFFPCLSPGGLMIVHDYGNPCWPGVKLAVDEYLRDRAERPVIMPDKCGTALIRKT